MNKRYSITVVALLTITMTAMAVVIAPFKSWDDLKSSPDIVIGRCTSTPPTEGPDGLVWSDIEVLSVLKGDTKPGTARMVSPYWPHQGGRFLIFSGYETNQYNAIGTYRVVPLGRDFQIDTLAGKKLDEQIQLVLRSRLEDLKRELERGTEEKKRLEQALK